MKRLIQVFIVVLLCNVLLNVAPEKVALANTNSNVVDDEYLQNLNKDKKDTPTVSDEKSKNEETVGLTFFDYVKTLFFLIVVLAILIYVLKFIGKKSASYQQNSIVKNLGGTSLGAQKSVQLIRIGDKIYVIGVGDDVQLIKEITDPNEVEEILNQYNERQTISTSAPKLLDAAKNLLNSTKKDDSLTNENNDFGNIFKKKIADITKERHSELEKWKEKERDK